MPTIVTELEGLPIKYEGIAAQIEHAKESDRQTEGKNRHYHFNLYLTEEEEGVVAHYCFMNVNAGGAPMAAKIVVTGRHRDTIVKTNDGWKFARRYVMFDQSFDLNFLMAGRPICRPTCRGRVGAVHSRSTATRRSHGFDQRDPFGGQIQRQPSLAVEPS